MTKSTRSLGNLGPPIREPIQPRKLPGQTHEHLHELQEKQHELETRVAELGRTSKTSEAALKRTRKQVIDLTNALAPISCIPDDILHATFRTAYSAHCGAWRKPHHFARHIASLEQALKSLKLQLRRSGRTLPSSVTFGFGHRTYDSAWGTCNSTESSEEFCAPKKHLDLMLAHVARWRTLTIRAADFRPVFDVFQYLRDLTAPVLDSLEVETPDIYNEASSDFMIIVSPEHDEFRIFDEGAPLLRSVDVVGLEFPEHFDFPKEALRRLKAGTAGLRELVVNETLVKPMEEEDRVVEIPSVVSVRVQNRYMERWYGRSEALKWTVRNAEETEFVLPSL
ncbi:hypothetical protein Hypma_012303 [Hypsizygus marmoreus]|uniref:Uncharacterized protein n=1 Tax=Hypsizygus marmoreus TaxID=39966 RepID=A0A369JMT4_HYPMA|nr:hypothetical protein Hypma_012303 [Hypsizygus marmoreus]